MKFKFKEFLYYLMSFLLFSNYAHAYLDPGTGGLIIQALLAFMIGIGVYFRTIKTKLISFFKKKQKVSK